ncbi:sigma-70 family RNA polymerase sigma factor [Urbifossiella limnaea]|uniref:ECF RNA polymerase sigma factor SigE n=1 Tax=Urbifossiella limnaea TaxID=2528023 RepID=A0A517XN36_9BACT|nr:sigma-70 family RNA polymerase sigma factor [Urbifossiella limnaea]QDU18925.1 ECF RNA polymerase sigma factor SigE [Urbifossiella limnaea]
MPTAPVSLMPALRRVIAGRAAERGDDDLLTAFVADRDPEAFAALVRRHGPMVLGVCRRVVRDYDAADDAFQAVFLVLARRAADVRPRNRVGAWLYGVAYRTALKARAARARRRTRESQVDAMPEPAAPPAADGWDELKPVLDEELARLPDRLRVPVVLCDLEGRPQRAVAGQLGIAPATLAGRLADARKALAARLTRRGVTLSATALGALLAEKASAGVVNPQLAAGVVRAAEAVAAGGAAAGLVSANALQLCDGVMRMIFLTKLKAAAATAAVLLAVAGAVGPGLKPATAGEAPAATATATATALLADDDAAYLDQVCLMFRNSKATAVEHGYFAADKDADKRKKVARWLIDGPTAPATAARTVTLGADGAQPFFTDAFDRVVVWDADTAKPAGVQAHPVVQWADLARFIDVQKGAREERRVEVVVPGDKDAKPAAPGEPVRVKVVVATDDGKGGVKYTVEERLAVPSKAAEPKATTVQGYKVEVVTPPGKAGPPQALLRWVGDGSKPAGLQSPDQTVRLWAAQPPGKGEEKRFTMTWATSKDGAEPDAAFLRRAVTEARGTPPTALEERYFAADPDPRKREKLLDALLADPAALRRVGDGWKRRMLTPQPLTAPATPKEKVLEIYRGSDLTVQPKIEVVPYTPQGKLVVPYVAPSPVAPPKFEVVPLPKGDVQPFLYTQPKAVVRDLLLDEKGNVPQPRIEVRDLLVTPKADVVKPKVVTPPAPPAPPAPPKVGVPAPPKAALPKVAPPAPAAPAVRATSTRVVSDKWGRLVGELIAAGKTDEQMLESLSLAAAGRLPTEVERRLSLAVLPTAADRAAGWTAVARALAGPPTPPTPPAPPPLPRSPQ